jgi:hypothetical protein
MTVTTRKEGVVVPPMSEALIARSAAALRKLVQLEGVRRFPVLQLYEMLWAIDPAARFEVVEDHLMGDDDARTYPERALILLRQSVYDGAARGEGRARFTMCHELGHLCMHCGGSFSRIKPSAPPKIFQNSEWQADVFAAHLMMPSSLMRDYSDPMSVMADFGVSYAAAETRLRKMFQSAPDPLRKMKKGVTKQAS